MAREGARATGSAPITRSSIFGASGLGLLPSVLVLLTPRRALLALRKDQARRREQNLDLRRDPHVQTYAAARPARCCANARLNGYQPYSFQRGFAGQGRSVHMEPSADQSCLDLVAECSHQMMTKRGLGETSRFALPCACVLVAVSGQLMKVSPGLMSACLIDRLTPPAKQQPKHANAPEGRQTSARRRKASTSLHSPSASECRNPSTCTVLQW
jgi:hypothetical protein